MSDEYIEGIRAAEQVPLTQHMHDLLVEHGFGAAFLDGLWADEERHIPDCPYEDDEQQDEWNTGFAHGMEHRA